MLKNFDSINPLSLVDALAITVGAFLFLFPVSHLTSSAEKFPIQVSREKGTRAISGYHRIYQLLSAFHISHQ